MSTKTGLTLTLWTSKDELYNAKNGGSTLIASKSKTKDADIEISVSLDACDILDNEVRVNLTLVRQNINDIGQSLGESMGKELERIFKQYS